MDGEWDDFEKAPAQAESFDDFAEAAPVAAPALVESAAAPDPDERLGQILAVTDDPNATDDEQVYRLQKITRQPSEVIREWLPGTRARVLSVGGSAAEFRRKYPVKAAVMEHDPQAAGVVRVDEDINVLERIGRYIQRAQDFVDTLPKGPVTPEKIAAGQSEVESYLKESATLGEAVVSPSTAPKEMVSRTVEKRAAKSAELTGVARLLGEGWSFNPAAFLTEKGAEGYGVDPEKTKKPLVSQETSGALQASLEYEIKSLEAAQVMNGPAEIAAAEGDSPAFWAALVKAQDARNAVGLPPELKLGPVESVINLANPLLASQYRSIAGSTLARGGAQVAIKGAQLVPGVVGKVARTRAVKTGAQVVAGEIGGALMMYPTERGSQFGQFLDLKTADGKPIDVRVAGRASAVGAAVVSLLDAEGSRQVVLASGPWGRKLAGLNKETQRGFIRALLTNRETAESFGKFLLATSRPVVKGAATEGGLEGLQDIVADLSGFFTKVFSGTEGEARFGRLMTEAAVARPVESLAGAAQTAVSTAVGVGVIAAPGHALTLAHAVTARQQGLRRGADVATLAGVATASKTAQVAPKAVQHAITTLMQQKGATAPESVYVPVEEAERFFQAGGVADADIPTAIQQTLGDAAAASYHEAAEGLNGGKIRIPMADYLSKAGPTGFADAMVQDTALSPTDKTVRQARRERAEIDAGAKKLADEYEKTDVPHASEAESIMVGAVESWLDSQKMLDEDGRRKVVSLWRAMARTMAERFGLPEDVLFDTFTVEAMTKAGDKANPAKVMPQAAASRNIITSWRAKTPEERVRAFYEDRITGTLNPRGLDALIKEKKPPLMVVWDIAGGKAINDDRKTGGHEVLDQVFRGVAQTVHAAAPGRTGKQGGSIVALVGSQDEADKLVEKVLAAHPEKRVKLRAWVGPVTGTAKQTVKAIGEASKKTKDEQEAAGVWPKRGEAPVEWGGAVPAELAKGAARTTGTDITPAMRAAYEGLSDFQRASAIYVNQFSEILTNDGWETIREKGTKAVTASVDVDGLKALNKALGEDGADAVLDIFGRLVSRAGGPDVDAAWLHGDEYAGQHDEEKPLRDFWDKVRREAADLYLEIDVGEGRIAVVDGVRFSFGTGATYADADRALQDEKQHRTDVGERGPEVDARSVRVVAAGELQGHRDEVRRRRALEGRGVAEVAGSNDADASVRRGVPEAARVARRGQSLSELAWRPADVLQKDTASAIREVLEQAGRRATDEEVSGIKGRLRAAHPEVTFDPQIKSATGNPGTFDPTNPNILKQDGTEGARGWVEILRGAVNRTIRIVLTPDANLSTILHETGHAYMEVLSSLSERADAPAQMKSDWETAKAWMGVKPGEVVSREHAEKWARGFEAYLMEGKAPSAALARVFTRFRSWLLQVYREIRHLNAPLDDEIRGVFDRLLATDDEITAMRQRYEPQGPIFKTPEEAGMEATVYQAWLDQQEDAWSARRIAFQKRILKEQDKEARAAIRDTRKRLKGEVEAAWEERPDVQAWGFVRRGTVPEGAPELARMLLEAQARVPTKATQLTPEQVKRVTEIETDIRRLTAERGLEARAQEILAAPGKKLTVDEARERARAEAAEKAQDPLALSSPLRIVPVVVTHPEGAGTTGEVAGAWGGETLEQGGEIRSLSLPSWLTLEDFSAEPAVWEATWAALHGRKRELRGKAGRVVSTREIARTGQTAPEAVQRLVADYFRRGMEAFPADRGEMLRGYVLGKLLSGGMRGELVTKFKDQIGAWLATAPAARKYDSPLSLKQIDVLTKHASEGFKKWEADSKVQRPWLGQPLTAEAAQALPVAEVDESAQGAIDGKIATLRAEADQIAAQARGEAAKGVRVGLDYGAVVGVVGPEEAARAFRGAMLTEGGVAPDDLAAALGQPSGEALVREMAATPERDAWVKEETERRLSSEHPSLLEDAKARREAMAGFVHSVGDSKAFEDELRAVRSKAGEEGAPIDYIKRAAKVIVARKAVGEVRPDLALQDELTAANEALRAAARGNWKQVAVQKQRQLLAHFVWREMEAARKQADALDTLGKRLQKNAARARLAKGGPAFLDGVDAILDALGVQDLPDVGRYPRGGLEGAVSAIERSGGSVMFDPETVQQAMNQARREPEDLTVEQQGAILDALRNISKVGGEVSRAILGGKRVDRESLIGSLIAESQANLPRGKAPVEDAAKTWWQQVGSAFSGFDGALLRPARVLGWLGGADADGVANIHSAWYQAFVLPMQRAKAEEARILRETVRPIMDAWEKMPKSVRARMQDAVDGAALFPNHTQNLQPPAKRFELLLMALNSGNDSNLQRLLEGRGITPEQLQQALDLLTREEMEWVQSVLDAAESLWPMSQALELRVAGVAPPKIEARPLVTVAGTFRGGYFPAVYAKGAGGFGNVGEVQAAADVAGFFDALFARPGTQHSHLKGRAKEFAAPISFDPKVIQAHFAQVAHDLAFREAILSTAGLILDPRVQVELNRSIGPERAEQLRTWLEDVGRGRGAQPDKHGGPLDRFLGWSKGRMAVMTMGYAADIAAGDLSNVLVAAVELDKKHWAAGLSEYGAHPFKTREFALTMSGELRFRADRIVEDFRQQIGALGGKSTNPIIKHAWAFMEATDAATVTPFWLGAFRQAAAKGMSEADAVIWADAMVNKNFPSHSVVDMAPILRGKGAASSLLFLHGFANTTYGVTRDQLHRVYVSLTGDEVGGERITKVAKVSAKVTGHLLGYWVAYGVVGEFLSGRGPTDDDDDGELSADEWVSWFWRKLVLAPVYSIPLVGATVEGLVMGKPVSARSAPGLSLVERLVRQGMRVTKEGSGASEWIALGAAAGGALGYPTARPARAVDYVRKTLAGETEVEGPLDFLGGVVYGDHEGQGLNPAEAGSRAVEE